MTFSEFAVLMMGIFILLIGAVFVAAILMVVVTTIQEALENILMEEDPDAKK